jgi:hypothetical protein
MIPQQSFENDDLSPTMRFTGWLGPKAAKAGFLVVTVRWNGKKELFPNSKIVNRKSLYAQSSVIT